MTSCLRLKKSNCKNCYKCIRHCPVKSIRFSAEQAHIIDDECILCGQCFVVCPQDAKQIVDETEKVKVLIGSGEPVIASLAPSFIANYDGVGIESMREALKKLGFHDVEETAIGATMVKREYDRMLRDENRDIVISSCCHSINLLIRKYFPEQLPYLADVVSPMVAHCIDIKRRIPNAKTVFIGPCVAKKDEADQHSDVVDAALTFEELTSWLKEEQIELKKEVITDDKGLARFFPTPGGILKTMAQDAPGFTYMALDGIDACLAALDDIAQGKIHKCFIEMSTCSGSCIGGPVMEKYRRSPVADYMAVANFAGKNDFDVAVLFDQSLGKRIHDIAESAGLYERIALGADERDASSGLGQFGLCRSFFSCRSFFLNFFCGSFFCFIIAKCSCLDLLDFCCCSVCVGFDLLYYSCCVSLGLCFCFCCVSLDRFYFFLDSLNDRSRVGLNLFDDSLCVCLCFRFCFCRIRLNCLYLSLDFLDNGSEAFLDLSDCRGLCLNCRRLGLLRCCLSGSCGLLCRSFLRIFLSCSLLGCGLSGSLLDRLCSLFLLVCRVSLCCLSRSLLSCGLACCGLLSSLRSLCFLDLFDGCLHLFFCCFRSCFFLGHNPISPFENKFNGGCYETNF